MNCSIRSNAPGHTASSRPTRTVLAGSLYAVRHLRPSVVVSSAAESPCRVSMQV